MQYELAFIGAGNMAEAIARAAIDRDVVSPAGMIAADPSEERRGVFESLGMKTTDDNAHAAGAARQVMLAVKPQRFAEAAEALRGIDRERQIVLSIMAGIESGVIESALGGPARVVRIMPNTPVLAGCGMAGIALGEHAQADDDDLAMRLFSAAGKAVRVSEDALHAVTAVSGSGPAYVFYLAEAMEAAAAELGLGEHGRQLVAQTMLGAAKLLSESSDSAAELRRKVTSPGGTTERAIGCFEEHHLRAIIAEGMAACEVRSRELGRGG